MTLAISLLLIVTGLLLIRFCQGIAALKKSADEEWGLKTETAGQAFFVKVVGVGSLVTGIAGLVMRLLPT
jgi:hypothetical protein